MAHEKFWYTDYAPAAWPRKAVDRAIVAAQLIISAMFAQGGAVQADSIKTRVET